MVLGRGSAEVLPSGWFPLAVFLRVACLRSGGGGFGWLSLAGPYVLRDVIPGACLLLSSSPLALHGVVSPSPVCLSRAPAFRQVRVALLAEGSVESPSVLVLAFHSSLFLVEGSSDGSAPGDRSSPLDGCVYSLRFLLRSVASALSLLGSWAFSSSSVCQFTVGSGGTFPRGNWSEFPLVFRLPVLYLVEFCLT